MMDNPQYLLQVPRRRRRSDTKATNKRCRLVAPSVTPRMATHKSQQLLQMTGFVAPIAPVLDIDEFAPRYDQHVIQFYDFEERAAIMQIDGELSRSDAEKMAAGSWKTV